MSDVWRKTLVYLGLVEEPEEHDEHELGVPAQPGPPEDRTTTVRSLRPEDRQTHVRQVDRDIPRVVIVRVAAFDDAEEVGDRYRRGQPVLLDLGGSDQRTGRRMLDFVSGVIFAMRGRIVPAGERAFLLVPDGLEVPSEERRRLEDLGYPVASAPPAR